MKKRISILLCVVMLIALLPANAFAAAIGESYITSRGACVMDPETGEFYYEYNADEPLAPASMTKVMTTYIIYEKLAEGVIGKDTMITADAEDEAASLDSEASNVFLKEGESYSIDNLLGAIVVPSACAACEMVGKYLCGSKEAFWELMNQTVGQLGLEAYYADASGLSDDNSITAHSMAVLAAKLITDYPDVLNYTSKPYITFGGITYRSTNHMLPGDSWEYPGTDGLKTGTTEKAGCCFCGTAVRDGRRLVSVTMNSSTTGQRFADTIQLLDYGFRAAADKYDSIYFTDMRVFMNGAEMPTFAYNGGETHALIVAEDLNDYGFDVSYDENAKTVTAKNNPDKEIKPIPLESYKGKNNQKANTIIDSPVRVVIEDGGRKHEIANTYNIGGYVCISAGDFRDIYDFEWDGAAETAYIAAAGRTVPVVGAAATVTGASENKPEEITINIDGNYILPFPDQKPVLKNDRVLIPIRPLMEMLGKTVDWDEDKQQTTISDGTTSVCLTVGSGVMEKTVTNSIDGTVKTEEVTLDAPPEIIGGRTCLPVRAVVEAFGAAVEWDAETGTVLITAGVR